MDGAAQKKSQFLDLIVLQMMDQEVEFHMSNTNKIMSGSIQPIQVVSLTFQEGEHTIPMRAVDNVGNVGNSIDVEIKVDTSEPIGIGWTVPELSTSIIGAVNISFRAEDLGSGIDNSSSKIQFGFDLNGVGATPDQSGRWIDYGDSGLDGSVALASWISKSRQYLMLRAVVTDNAGNELTTIPAAYQILPGKDLWWNASETNLDRLVVRPGDTNGKVVITSLLEANQDWTNDVKVILQAAPADRTADVDWTTMKTVIVTANNISDECNCEEITWEYTVPNTGQWDLRLVIDPDNSLDERDEANNNYHLMVTGASVTGIGVVSSFAPSVYAILIVGFCLSYLSEKEDYSSSQLISSSSAKIIISVTSSSFSGSTCDAFILRFLRLATSDNPELNLRIQILWFLHRSLPQCNQEILIPF